MNEMELELSRLFNAVIGEPPGQVSVHAVRRRAARHRRLTYVTATAALAVAGSLGVAFASTTTTQHRSASDHKTAARIPAYYFEQTPGNGTTRPPVNTIRSTATGAIAGTFKCPAPSPFPVSAVAAGGSPSSTTFFMACSTATKNHPHRVTGSKIYELTVSRSGHVSALKLMPGGTLAHQVPMDLGASPDGSELAVSDYVSGYRVLVINTKTGRQAVWTADAPGGGELQSLSLSFADRGRELAAFGRVSGGTEMVSVSPAWQGGNLDSGHVVFSGYQDVPSPVAAILSPSGKTVTLGGLDNRAGSRVVSINAVTGKMTRVLLTIRKGGLRFLAEDPSGRFILVVGGYTHNAFNGWIKNGNLVPLPGLRGLPNTETW